MRLMYSVQYWRHSAKYLFSAHTGGQMKEIGISGRKRPSGTGLSNSSVQHRLGLQKAESDTSTPLKNRWNGPNGEQEHSLRDFILRYILNFIQMKNAEILNGLKCNTAPCTLGGPVPLQTPT